MTHYFHKNELSGGSPVSIATSGTTCTALHQVAPGGKSYIQMLVVGAAADLPITVSGGTITSGNADFYLRSKTFTSLASGNQRRIIVIVFNPSSTGTKTGNFNITIEGTEYDVTLQGTCAAQALAIKVTDGGTNREAPCGISARLDMDNTRLPAPFKDCYFKWVVTPPSGETFTVNDTREFTTGSFNLFDHYPGCAITVPVLEGQHGTWGIRCYGYIPGDTGLSPSLDSGTTNVVVDALGTNKVTKHVTATGRGSNSGDDFANAYSYANMRSNLATNRHFILYDDDGTFSHSAALDFGNYENLSVVANTGDNPKFVGTNATQAIISMGGTKGLFLKGFDVSPEGVAGIQQTAVQNWSSKTACLYEIDFLGDGLSGGAHVGSSFQYIFINAIDTGAINESTPNPMTSWPEGTGIIKCTGQPTEDYSILGMSVGFVEVGSDFKASLNESCLRWLHQVGYPTGTETNPHQDRGAWFYNAVLTKHSMAGDLSSPKQTWRFMGDIFFTLHMCVSEGEMWLPMGSNASGTGENVQPCFDVAIWHSDLKLIPFGNSIIDFRYGATGFGIRGCYLERADHNNPVIKYHEDCSVVNCTLNITTGAAKAITGNYGDWYGDSSETRLSFDWQSNIVIATVDTSNSWIDDVSISGGGWPTRKNNCVANSIFPLTAANANDYDINGSTYSTPAAANATAQADNISELDVTLDANGRPNQSVNVGRDSRYYFDYFLKPLTSADDWAGMTQSAIALTRMRIRT